MQKNVVCKQKRFKTRTKKNCYMLNLRLPDFIHKGLINYMPVLVQMILIMRITTRLKSSVGIWPDKFPLKHS